MNKKIIVVIFVLIFVLILVILILTNFTEKFVSFKLPSGDKNINDNPNILRYLSYSNVDNLGLEMTYKEFNNIIKNIIKNIPKNNYSLLPYS